MIVKFTTSYGIRAQHQVSVVHLFTSKITWNSYYKIKTYVKSKFPLNCKHIFLFKIVTVREPYIHRQTRSYDYIMRICCLYHVSFVYNIYHVSIYKMYNYQVMSLLFTYIKNCICEGDYPPKDNLSFNQFTGFQVFLLFHYVFVFCFFI